MNSSRIRNNISKKTASVQSAKGHEDAKSAPPPQAETPATLADLRKDLNTAFDCLFDVVGATEALKLLMFIVIEHDSSERFTIDNGYLAAGLETLVWTNKHELKLAQDMVLDVLKKFP
jgi:hypothetical protein